MARLRRSSLIIIAVALLTFTGSSVFGASAKVTKSITPMEDGNFLIKLKVTSSNSSIYGLKLIDSNASIIDVYAPRGWCIVTDGEDLVARTSDAPIKAGKSLEYIIHSNTDDVKYTWTVHGRLKQLGKAGTL